MMVVKHVTKIFLSHSKADEEIRDYFLKVFAIEGVQAVSVEFEYFPPPPWSFIKNKILESDALFLLLGPNVIDRGIYTQNWISFELGLACLLNKDIWVFEQFNIPVRFPVPYLNHYLLYDPKDRTSFDYIRGITRTYKVTPFLRATPGGYAEVTCPNDDCRISFRLHSKVSEFECPSCRKKMKFL
jgi:hypothetical protein